MGPSPQALLPCCNTNGPVMEIVVRVIGLWPLLVTTTWTGGDVIPTCDVRLADVGLTEIAY